MIILMSYLFICYTHSTGNEGENNFSSNTSTFIESLKAVYDNKSINIFEDTKISEGDQTAGIIHK